MGWDVFLTACLGWDLLEGFSLLFRVLRCWYWCYVVGIGVTLLVLVLRCCSGVTLLFCCYYVVLLLLRCSVVTTLFCCYYVVMLIQIN